MQSQIFVRYRRFMLCSIRITHSGAACASTFTPPNRLSNLILSRYNRAKGKRLYFAWLRSGGISTSDDANYLCGIGDIGDALPVRHLAVRPALPLLPRQTGCQTSYFCGIIGQRVKDFILLGCVPAPMAMLIMHFIYRDPVLLTTRFRIYA